MKRLFIFWSLITLMQASFLRAQNVPPALMVQGEEGWAPLKVSSLAVESRISGILAETRMTMSFYNPSRRQLAGDLYFPLPEGATVSGYALDINGRLVDGVVVEKQRARQVFEKIVRRGIDPGLVEWVKGNSFKTRVFPIPPLGSRTVMVRYLSELTDDGERAIYRLPLRFAEPVADFSIRVEVIKPAAGPEVRQVSFGSLYFQGRREGYVAQKRIRNAELNRDLVIAVPAPDRQPVQVEKTPDGTVYFALNASTPDIHISRKAIVPRRIALFWDASRSRAGSDHERAYRLLLAYFRQLHREIGSRGLDSTAITVDLVIFRNEAEAAGSYLIKNGDAGPLIQFLKTLDYDGGTQLGALPAPAAGTDLVLLFTDGLSNFGTGEPGGFGVPLYIFAGEAAVNHPFLRYLALKNGGEYFNLNRLLESAVIERIGRPVCRFLGAKVAGGQIEEGYPKLPQPAAGRFTFLAKLKTSRADIVLQYGLNSRVLKEVRYTVSRSDAVQGGLLELAWAQRKLTELQIYPRRNQALMIDLGKEFSLVTPGTSLIVLESLEQYVEHRIPPPASLPEMRKEYFTLIAQLRGEARQQKESKLKYILELWNQRVEWWNTTFKYPRDFRYQEEEEAKAEVEALPAPQAMEESMEMDLFKSMGEEPRERAATAPMAELESPGAGETPEPVEEESPDPGVVIRTWDPDMPYLRVLKNTERAALYSAYLDQSREYGDSPAFYLDCGDYFLRQQMPERSIRIWSNIAEMELENAALLRILAHRLAQEERLELSRLLFEEVLHLRPEEPQSYRDLALVLGRMGEYERAIQLLYAVVMRPWDRFQEIELIALMELNDLIPRARKAGIRSFPVDNRLIKLLDVDIRIILTWDADLTDMDLWVTEPSGEKAYYDHRRTTIGGHFSRDFTDGYGPEEYLLRKAMRGKYIIEVDYFASSAPTLSGSVILQVDVFTNYGRPNERRRSITVRLRESKETLQVGEITF